VTKTAIGKHTLRFAHFGGLAVESWRSIARNNHKSAIKIRIKYNSASEAHTNYAPIIIIFNLI